VRGIFGEWKLLGFFAFLCILVHGGGNWSVGELMVCVFDVVFFTPGS
jgi:hypothetical protein